MIDLYETLGLRKGAKANAIKRAFRTRAMKTHPDRGGAKEEFEAVKLAYEVLSDDARRAHYDATGEYARKADNTAAQSLLILTGVFSTVVAQILEAGKSPAKEDLAQLMRNALTQSIGVLKDKQQKLASAQKELESLVGRFTTEAGENVLDDMVRSQASMCAASLEKTALDIGRFTAAAELLKRFKFRFDKRQDPWDIISTTATSGMFFRGFAKAP